MDYQTYHRKRRRDFLAETRVRSIQDFSDGDKIRLAEAGATCYHPIEDTGWDMREWLESIHCVLNHGCCTKCEARAKELCIEYSEKGK